MLLKFYFGLILRELNLSFPSKAFNDILFMGKEVPRFQIHVHHYPFLPTASLKIAWLSFHLQRISYDIWSEVLVLDHGSNILCKLINLFTSHPLFLLENGFTFVEWMVIWKKRHWLYLRLVKYKKYFKLQGCQGCSVVSGSFSVCLIGPNTFLCTELLKELKRRKREQLGVSC